MFESLGEQFKAVRDAIEDKTKRAAIKEDLQRARVGDAQIFTGEVGMSVNDGKPEVGVGINCSAFSNAISNLWNSESHAESMARDAVRSIMRNHIPLLPTTLVRLGTHPHQPSWT